MSRSSTRGSLQLAVVPVAPAANDPEAASAAVIEPRKLDNAGFIAKAPSEVVERERKNLAAMEGERKSLEDRLAELS